MKQVTFETEHGNRRFAIVQRKGPDGIYFEVACKGGWYLSKGEKVYDDPGIFQMHYSNDTGSWHISDPGNLPFHIRGLESKLADIIFSMLID